MLLSCVLASVLEPHPSISYLDSEDILVMDSDFQHNSIPKPEDFHVGWLCTIPLELTAALSILDEKYSDAVTLKQDGNPYSLGRVGGHNVVVAVLSGTGYGISSATSIATHLVESFPNLRFGLIFDIVSMISTGYHDIRHGDIVVGRLDSNVADQYNNQQYFLCSRLTYTIAEESTKSRQLLDSYEAFSPQCSCNVGQHCSDACQKHKNIRSIKKSLHCGCAQRPPMGELDPYVHYGLIGSSNTILKSYRERLASNNDALCLEMEVAGVMNNFPCLVVRGICDDSDSHKNAAWQPYAAATAAAFAKELLLNISSKTLDQSQPPETISQSLDLSVETSMRRRQIHKSLEVEDKDTPDKHFAEVMKKNDVGICPKWERISTTELIRLFTSPHSNRISDIRKLGVALVAQVTGLFLWYHLDVEKCNTQHDILPPPQRNQTSPITGQDSGYCKSSLIGQIVLIMVYWTAQSSLIWRPTDKQHRLRYAFWTVIITFVGGLLLCSDIAIWVVFVLPTALSLSMGVCLIQENVAKQFRSTIYL